MVDGITPLKVEGETTVDLVCNGKTYRMSAIVADYSDAEILIGIPFMTNHDISIRPAKGQIMIGDGEEIISYNPQSGTCSTGTARYLQAYDVTAHTRTVILPGESFKADLPTCCETPVSVEPRFDLSHNRHVKEDKPWPRPHLVECIDNQICLVNDTEEPVVLKKHEKVCKVYQTSEQPQDSPFQSPEYNKTQPRSKIPLKKLEPYSTSVTLNADNILTPTAETQFRDLLLEYDDVFNPNISQYNGRSGRCSVDINIGHIQPPQRRGRVSQYCKGDMDELQR